MKFGFKTLFNLTLLKAAMSGLLSRLLTVTEFHYLAGKQDYEGMKPVRKRAMYLLSQDKAFLKLLQSDQRYVVDAALYEGRLIIAFFYAVDPVKQKISDGVRHRQGLKPVHSERCAARDRFRCVLYKGDLNVATRTQSRLLYNPYQPALVYAPEWGDQLRLLLEVATKATNKRYRLEVNTSRPDKSSHSEPCVPA